MKKDYMGVNDFLNDASSIYYNNVEEIQKSVNKNVNGDILLREYMDILGLTYKDLEGSMDEIRAKIRNNKISKIIK